MRIWRAFKQIGKKISELVNNAINTILLTLVYFIGVGLTAIVAKVVGKHFLSLEKEYKQSYWINRTPKSNKLEQYYRQF